MAVKPADVVRVADFRNRLVAFANYVNANVSRWEAPSPDVQTHVSEEQTALSQEYGRVAKVMSPYGQAMMRQFGMIVSQDVVRDAIQSPTHPGYGDLAQMAVGHLDMIIGQLRAEVEDAPAKRPQPDVVDEGRDWGFTSEDVYRVTSPIYWLGKLISLIGWLLSTTRGRVATLIGAVVLAVIGGIVSGAAQAWFERVFAGASPGP